MILIGDIDVFRFFCVCYFFDDFWGLGNLGVMFVGLGEMKGFEVFDLVLVFWVVVEIV